MYDQQPRKHKQDVALWSVSDALCSLGGVIMTNKINSFGLKRLIETKMCLPNYAGVCNVPDYSGNPDTAQINVIHLIIFYFISNTLD